MRRGHRVSATPSVAEFKQAERVRESAIVALQRIYRVAVSSMWTLYSDA
ncbi:MAG: hypothetical protein MI924_01965 [Chloroflexales bacterium]|nr:hypothetical protein [Chloroflexales bacterium]